MEAHNMIRKPMALVLGARQCSEAFADIRQGIDLPKDIP
jgi:hypothetical protein